MILAIDIGNTTVALGGIRDGRVCFVAHMDTVRTRTAAEYRAEMEKVFSHRRHPEKPIRFEGAVLTSVVPQITGALAECARHYTGKKPVIVSPEIRTGLLYSMGIAVGMHVVFLLLNALFRKALKLDAVEQVNIIYSNAAALVIPIVQALLGEEYVVYSCAFVIVQLVLLWTHASACLQGSARLEWRKLLTNVNLIAIAAGALLYLLHVSLPAPITSTLSSVGNMIGPMGMLLAGMAIAEVPLKKVFCTPRNYLPVFLRLLGVPLVIVLLLWAVHASLWIPDGKPILMTVYLSAITPACATVTSMAQLYDRDASHSSAIYVLSTLLSILTMPLMIGSFELLL